MTAPIQLQQLPSRKKPAKSRAFVLCIAIVCAAIFCAGLIAKCATPVFPIGG